MGQLLDGIGVTALLSLSTSFWGESIFLKRPSGCELYSVGEESQGPFVKLR